MSDKPTAGAMVAARAVTRLLNQLLAEELEAVGSRTLFESITEIIDRLAVRPERAELLEAAKVFAGMAMAADWGLEELAELAELRAAIAACERDTE